MAITTQKEGTLIETTPLGEVTVATQQSPRAGRRTSCEEMEGRHSAFGWGEPDGARCSLTEGSKVSASERVDGNRTISVENKCKSTVVSKTFSYAQALKTAFPRPDSANSSNKVSSRSQTPCDVLQTPRDEDEPSSNTPTQSELVLKLGTTTPTNIAAVSVPSPPSSNASRKLASPATTVAESSPGKMSDAQEALANHMVTAEDAEPSDMSGPKQDQVKKKIVSDSVAIVESKAETGGGAVGVVVTVAADDENQGTVIPSYIDHEEVEMLCEERNDLMPSVDSTPKENTDLFSHSDKTNPVITQLPTPLPVTSESVAVSTSKGLVLMGKHPSINVAVLGSADGMNVSPGLAPPPPHIPNLNEHNNVMNQQRLAARRHYAVAPPPPGGLPLGGSLIHIPPPLLRAMPQNLSATSTQVLEQGSLLDQSRLQHSQEPSYLHHSGIQPPPGAFNSGQTVMHGPVHPRPLFPNQQTLNPQQITVLNFLRQQQQQQMAMQKQTFLIQQQQQQTTLSKTPEHISLLEAVKVHRQAHPQLYLPVSTKSEVLHSQPINPYLLSGTRVAPPPMGPSVQPSPIFPPGMRVGGYTQPVLGPVPHISMESSTSVSQQLPVNIEVSRSTTQLTSTTLEEDNTDSMKSSNLSIKAMPFVPMSQATTATTKCNGFEQSTLTATTNSRKTAISTSSADVSQLLLQNRSGPSQATPPFSSQVSSVLMPRQAAMQHFPRPLPLPHLVNLQQPPVTTVDHRKDSYQIMAPPQTDHSLQHGCVPLHRKLPSGERRRQDLLGAKSNLPYRLPAHANVGEHVNAMAASLDMQAIHMPSQKMSKPYHYLTSGGKPFTNEMMARGGTQIYHEALQAMTSGPKRALLPTPTSHSSILPPRIPPSQPWTAIHCAPPPSSHGQQQQHLLYTAEQRSLHGYGTGPGLLGRGVSYLQNQI